ncbi:Putative outer membrane protein [Citrifermentans bremense]|uniref:Outer membrane protein n=1 Tax=Citrifermentans bremense TaxID=60035 RepID=A0A6S6LZE8_9BACT|nr:transporter [Citrifermentans bremense]BCG46688.1 Putative outer membrane protein [Citrifermentans bremense]
MKLSKRIIPLTLAALCTCAGLSWGADAPAVPQPFGPAISAFGPAGTGFPVGKLGVLLNYQYCETDGIRKGGSEVSDAVKLTKNVGVMKFRYGITEGLDVRTATPIYDVYKKNRATGEGQHLGWIGDTAIALHKVLLKQAKGAPLDLAVDVGLVVPTTDVSSKSVDFVGNGAWGAGGAVGVTYSTGSHRLDQEIHVYTFTEGSHDYRKPMYIRSTTAWGYAVNNYFDMGAESQFDWNDESEKNGVSQNDSKNEWYAGPKVAFKYKPAGFAAGLAAMFPFARSFEANTPSEGFRIELKLSKTFDIM